MKIVERYILREFTKIFLLTLMSFISLYLIIDVFEHIDDFIKHRVNFLTGGRFFLYKIPFVFYQVSPVAVLMATLISLGIFARHNEVVAAMAGGISAVRLSAPLFAAALSVSMCNFVLNESVLPLANQRVMAMKKVMEGGNRPATFAHDSIWFRDEMNIYNIKYAEPERGALKGIAVYSLDNDFNITGRIDAREAYWADGRWVARESRLLHFREDRLVDTSTEVNYTIPLAPAPDDLKNVERLADEMNFGELKRYIDRLEREGYIATRYLVDLHSKVSFPFVSIIMVLVGLPFAFRSGRHGGVAVGVGISIIVGFSYWVMFAVNTSLGYNGLIPPLVAAWLTNLIFAVLGILMFNSVKQ